MKRSQELDEVPAQIEAPVVERVPDKYLRVKFHAKSNVNDTDDVILSVNGEVLVIERQKPVVIPEKFVVCAENARYQQFRQMPNQPRKVVGEVLIYPFDRLGEATQEEFLSMKSTGTKKMMDEINRGAVA